MALGKGLEEKGQCSLDVKEWKRVWEAQEQEKRRPLPILTWGSCAQQVLEDTVRMVT